MTFLFYASDSFASRAAVLVDSIKKFHPDDKIMHVNPVGNYQLGSYIPNMAKHRLGKALELLEGGEDTVVVIGADCKLFAHLDIQWKGNVSLVPHVISPVVNRDYMAQLYRTGHANADLMVFSNTDEAKRCLKWLISVTEGNEPDKGIFYEQTWLSAIPFLFEQINIIRDPGINVGYWTENIDINNLKMVQFSGYVKGQPHRMSKYYDGPDVTGDVLTLFQEYDRRIDQ